MAVSPITDPHAVVDEEAASHLGAGVNFNAGEKARELRDESCQEAHPMTPEPVAQVMRPHGVQAGVADKNFEVGSGRGVGLEDGGDVFAYGLKEAHHVRVLSLRSALHFN